MQKKGYSSPTLELLKFQLTDAILTSVPKPTEEYEVPIYGINLYSDQERLDGMTKE